MDLRASYQFPIGKLVATISGQVNNVLNTLNIEKAWNPSTVSSSKQEVNPDDVYLFYSFGRTWSIRLKVAF